MEDYKLRDLRASHTLLVGSVAKTENISTGFVPFDLSRGSGHASASAEVVSKVVTERRGSK
jgi:hypothetical protein